ncbi:acetyltransferase, GNAT family protein [Pseudooceanicola batsensis HTCC2597]|uniref:Acetyltransferase, GNAT family protein n=1 Tax=Pseudooceanicola batsensis (strain ATCC BAA-863 / DSM 15984 / KCTC 12145 / HTCC2597) TaxID=252305 RepID=A3TY72_PSEBH|nr:GNAT family N-acetyltransferase [Pseudooceanicola batsensis]EAQ03106.1 acetyltransferase, GNAT family protein [Pseudooceanicola batsensis HTCC2597]
MTLTRDLPAFTVPVPRLETERLILRGPEGRDFPVVEEFARDAERTRYIGGAQTTDFEVWNGFCRSIGHWIWHGYGFWTLEEKATGAAVGRVGIINHLGWPEPELGWHAFAAGEGRGLVHEAALTIRAYAAGALGLDRIISQIHPDNARSRALAERLGATVERETELLGDPCLIYRHPAVREVAA